MTEMARGGDHAETGTEGEEDGLECRRRAVWTSKRFAGSVVALLGRHDGLTFNVERCKSLESC